MNMVYTEEREWRPFKRLMELDCSPEAEIRTPFLCLLEGVMLISLALCADAVIGNVQEKAMKLHNASNSEMVSTLAPSLHIRQTKTWWRA